MNEMTSMYDFLDEIGEITDSASESFNVDVTACKYFYRVILPKYRSVWKRVTDCNNPKERLKLLWDLKTILVEARQYVVGLVYHPVLATLEFLLICGATFGLGLLALSGAKILGPAALIVGGIPMIQWFIMLGSFIMHPSKAVRKYTRMYSFTALTHPDVGQEKVINQINQWIRDIDNMISQQQHDRYLDNYEVQTIAQSNSSDAYVKQTAAQIEAQSEKLVHKIHGMFGQIRSKASTSEDPEVQKLATESVTSTSMIDTVESIDAYMERIAMESSFMSEYEPNYVTDKHYIPGTANIKALAIWFGKFKPKMHKLKMKLYNAKTKADRLEILFEQKKLMLETREEIIRIPESTIINILFALAVTIIGVIIFLDAVGEIELIHGTLPAKILDAETYLPSRKYHGLADYVWKTGKFGLDWSANEKVHYSLFGGGALLIFYEIVKSITLVIKYPAAAQVATGHRNSGVMSKQFCVGHLNRYIDKIDKKISKIAKVEEGVPVQIEAKTLVKLEEQSKKGLDKMEQLFGVIKNKFA